MAYSMFGQVKNRNPIRDAWGIAPSLQHSLEKLYSRVSKITPPSSGSSSFKAYGLVNGGHQYVVTIHWNSSGEVDRVGLHKPGSGHHGDSELAYFLVQASGFGTKKLVHVDNFAKRGPDALHLRHHDKLLRRWNLAANAVVTGEISTTNPNPVW